MTNSMTADEWFAKRDEIAEKVGCGPKEVPAEAVWFIDLSPLTEEEISRAQDVAARIRLTAERPSDGDG